MSEDKSVRPTVEQVAELRRATGAGVALCKKALVDAELDVDRAIELLRAAGAVRAADAQQRRDPVEGLVASYVHNGRYGAMIEVNCETDFAAKTPEFAALCREIAMHVAAHDPCALCVRPESIPAEASFAALASLTSAAATANQKLPESEILKIATSEHAKWKRSAALLTQQHVRSTDVMVGDLVQITSAVLGEKIVIKRFMRYALGERQAQQ